MLKMTKILLVDDIPLITKSLSTIIDWQSFGYEIIGTAQDGKSALEIMKEIKTDILITDIKMPVMDGLELISVVKELNMKVKIIVVSAYNEYELVRNAFKLGASDYILKPEVKRDEIISICDRLRDELDNEENESITIDEGGSNFSPLLSSRNLILMDEYEEKNRFFRKILWGRADDFTKEEISIYLLQRNYGRNISFMLISLENSACLLKDKWDNDFDLFSFSIINILNEIVNRTVHGDVFNIRTELYGVLLYFDDSTAVKELTEKGYSIFNNVKNNMKKYMELEVSGGLSRLTKNPDEIQLLYSHAEIALRYRFVMGKGRLIFFESVPKMNREQNLNKNERIILLRDVLRAMDAEKIKGAAPYLILKDYEINLDNMEQVMDVYEKYTWSFIDFSREYGIQEECEKLAVEFFGSLSKKGSLDELNSWTNRMISLFTQNLISKNQILNKAKNYICNHYCENITLASVADEIYVSRGHLSRVFQKETGKTFLDYLNSFRIDKAKEIMMENSSLKIYEVADMVGYKSVPHFNKVFKRIYGKTPNEFKSLCN